MKPAQIRAIIGKTRTVKFVRRLLTVPSAFDPAGATVSEICLRRFRSLMILRSAHAHDNHVEHWPRPRICKYRQRDGPPLPFPASDVPTRRPTVAEANAINETVPVKSRPCEPDIFSAAHAAAAHAEEMRSALWSDLLRRLFVLGPAIAARPVGACRRENGLLLA